MQVSGPGEALELVEREVPTPGCGHVLVRVEAWGVCHSDASTVEAGMAAEHHRAPGHEIAGRIEALGEGTTPREVGQRVGVGWFGGACGRCDPCRRGDTISCVDGEVPGLAYDGGYADHVVVPKDALASVPDDLVAVLGIGGLGHLGVKFARRMGFETMAIARGTGKEEQARALGAHHDVDSTAVDVAEALQALGGATTILATVTAPEAMSAAIGGLRPRGTMVVVGVSGEPMQIAPGALRFSALNDARAMVETCPLERAAEGHARMMSGDARFRVVLTTGA